MRQVPVFAPHFDMLENELIAKCLQSGWVAQGPMVAEFEKMVADYEGVKHGVAVTSCTTAIHLALVAMGLESKHDVLIPSFTFIATANAVEYTGATAVLVDVRTDTYCIDTVFLEKYIDERYVKNANVWVNRKTGKELWGVIPVGLFGICADIHEVNRIAKQYNIHVLEDNACALGANIDGVHEGGFGNPTCLSFHARKSITTGEGGMVLTNDTDLANTIRKLRTHGASVSATERHAGRGFLMPNFDELGYNYRMTDVQGAMGVAQMRKYNTILEKKRAVAKRYDDMLTAVPFLQIPTTPSRQSHTYQSYVCMVDYVAMGCKTIEEGNLLRNKLMAFLEDNGVSTRQGTHAVHMLGYYRNRYGYKPNELPGAYACDKLSIAIPLYADLSTSDQDYVIETLKSGI
ncbi:MAG: DegT/DnrJ/EryC1/StrS aminotransferase family protein [Defluviitaleaceae bacterium]|nr:DegT/DnrJ/EryC1/StrS aminotransferase family protein [Defluviitaleaceae bacterium]